MSKKNLLLSLVILIVLFGTYLYFQKNQKNISDQVDDVIQEKIKPSMSISALRSRDYPGSEILIEETLDDGINYKRYIASYKSDGLKIYGLLTVPNESKQTNKTPAIIFLHGYLPPKEYVTIERYVQYQDAFARAGYVTFKPDLRGHGQSEGTPVNSNFSEDYVVDTLNALNSVLKMKEVDPQKIGMWGHSNGGGITLRLMVISKKIKAAVIWAGVVGNYDDLIERYRKRIPWMNIEGGQLPTGVREIVEKHGSPSATSEFWASVDPYNYLPNVSAKVQLHHGELDDSVPVEFSEHLFDALKSEKKSVEIFTYPNSDHNIAQDYSLAMERSVHFFNKYLK